MSNSQSGAAVASVLAGVVAFGWQGLGVGAMDSSCAFRFAGYLNISEPPTWIVPSVDTVTSTVLNEFNPIIYPGTDEANGNETTEALNCTATSWRYMLTDDTYETVVTYPDSEFNTTNTEVAFADLFTAQGEDLYVSPIPAGKAVAVSDSLFGRPIEVALSCSGQQQVTSDDESCVLFHANFTNTSPIPDVETALYRFTDPAVPGVIMPLAGNSSPGDIQLNQGNPIVQLDGSDVEIGCNGDIAEYLGEDGEWYFWFTGSNGQMYNLTHVFYATEQTHLNIATIQEVWSPNLEAALYNRTLRMSIYCNNIDVREVGHIYFRVGNGTDLSCEDYPCLCDGVGVGCTNAAAARYGEGWIMGARGGMAAASGFALTALGVASTLVLVPLA